MDTEPGQLQDDELLQRSRTLRYAVHTEGSKFRRKATAHEAEVRRRFTGYGALDPEPPTERRPTSWLRRMKHFLRRKVWRGL